MISLGTAIGAAAAGQRQRIAALETRTVIVTGTEAVVTSGTQPAGTIRFATDTGRVMVSTGSTWVGTSVGSAPAASATSGSSITGAVVTAGASATSGSSITGAVTSGALSGEAIGEGTGEGTAVGSTTSGTLSGEAIGEGTGEGTAIGSTTSGALSGEAIGEGSGEGTAVGSTTSAFSQTYSLSLDGANDYAPIVGSLSAGTYNFLTSTLTYTASMWFKLDDYTQNSSQVLLANNYTGSNVGLQVWYDNRSGISTNALRVNSWAGSSVSTNTSSAISDNNWHHLVITATGASGTLTVYLDGSSLTSTSLGATTATAPNQDLAIGGRIISGSVNSPIDGNMDEVALWSSALSASEVTAIYNSGTPTDLSTDAGNYTSSSNLVGWWRMEEGSGTSIADSSTNSNTGTLTNGPTFSTNTP